ncbi:MAG: general secretion pathway protein GspK, partial [Planctomycetes bacterium]|nr:general secretion pathway protein GspK [Planctomycetota bacterium]
AQWIYEKHRGAKSIGDLISASSPKTKPRSSPSRPTPIDLATYSEIIDQITVNESKVRYGLVNINTASREVLIALAEGDEELGEALYGLRESNLFSITSLSTLLEDQAIGIEGFKKIVDKICVNSNVFLATSLAKSQFSRCQYRVKALLSRKDNNINMIYWRQGVVQ